MKSASVEQEHNLEEQIRQRTFQLYQARGCEAGHELDDWLQAEACESDIGAVTRLSL